ncbi:uncharacterized protein CCOS01_02582 [Colletotrichum costaricense]|uniref:Uncharacterized protein n=1 Tax=Colletotrichum costaricense TaxID=1209916 RepID=A0AAJ0E5I3_9PEZI|nr:uncharacterized protein CCOS01_02582 [Colletotrichum costaricense]KAK1537262.1 hypothetical protein CCOS01_02582 [Colletotrichum costaricense]
MARTVAAQDRKRKNKQDGARVREMNITDVLRKETQAGKVRVANREGEVLLGGIGYKRVTCGSRPEDGQEDQVESPWRPGMASRRLISRVPRARSEEHQNVANANVAKGNRLTRMGIRQSGTARKWEQQPDEMEGAASEGGVEGSVGLALAVRNARDGRANKSCIGQAPCAVRSPQSAVYSTSQRRVSWHGQAAHVIASWVSGSPFAVRFCLTHDKSATARWIDGSGGGSADVVHQLSSKPPRTNRVHHRGKKEIIAK